MFFKLFSLGGVFSRKEYLLYGLIAPIVIFSLLLSVATLLKVPSLIELSILITLILLFIGSLKRARETSASNFLTMLLWFIMPPIVILYLLLSPAKVIAEGSES